jgi:hypothetical protein
MSRLINIPIGETGKVNGQLYRAEDDLFGCVGCDLSDNGNGCLNKNIVCWAPRRTFKLVEQDPNEEIIRQQTEDYYDRKLERNGCRQGLGILILGTVIFWGFVLKLITFIIHLF